MVEQWLAGSKIVGSIPARIFFYFFFGACAKYFLPVFLRKFDACIVACVKFAKMCKILY